MPCPREFLSRLDALHLSTVPWLNTACSPELLVLVLFLLFIFLMKCVIDHLEGKLHEETDWSANRDEVGLSHLGMLFITNVLAKGWLLNLDSLLKGHCSFQQDLWGMVKSGKALLQILPGVEKCSVLQHRKGWKEVLLEVFASLLYSLFSSWSNKLSSCRSNFFRCTQ